MWTSNDQQHLDALRERADAGTITDDERERLVALLGQLDRDESTSLQPMVDRLSTQRQQLQSELDLTGGRNAVLADLVNRQAAVLERARRDLRELVAEHERIVRDAERALGHPLSAA